MASFPNMSPLHGGIQISYDGKRTRNRLAQRRRREKQKLQNTTGKQLTPPPQVATDETMPVPSSSMDMIAWTQLGENVQFTTPASLHSWCAASESVLASPWMDAAVAAPTPSEQQQQQQQHADLFLFNDEGMFQVDTNAVIDPLLRPLQETPPSPRRSSITDVHRSPCIPAGGIPMQDQSQQHHQAIRSSSSRSPYLRQYSITSPSLSSPGDTRPPSSCSSAALALAAYPDAAAAAAPAQAKPVDAAATEQSVAKILVLAEEMGFETFDDLAATYYTAPFSERSLPRYAQSASRSRRLRVLLLALHASARGWTGREAQGYREGQRRLLETVCVEELDGVGSSAAGKMTTTTTPQSQRQMRRTRAFITNMIKQLFTEEGAEQLLQQDKQLLKEQTPSLWSLLSQIAQKANSEAEDSSLAICVFIYLLQVPL